jgi:hypothetical protein
MLYLHHQYESNPGPLMDISTIKILKLCMCIIITYIQLLCHEHFQLLFSFMTYHLVCHYINTTGATSGARTTYPSGAPEGR